MDTKRYKKRIILLVIFFIISFFIAFSIKNVLYDYVGELKSIKSQLETVEVEDEQKLLDKLNSGSNKYKSKEDVMKVINSNLEYFSFVEQYTPTQMVISSTYSLFALFNGVMLFFVFASFIITKYLPDLKKWMIVILEIAIFIFILPTFQFIALFGLVATIPNVLYNIYKYIKLRKTQTIQKDDIITEK